MRGILACLVVALLFLGSGASAEPLTRKAALETARSFAEYSWSATARNVQHGVDRAKVDVQTPDDTGSSGDERLWSVNHVNTGIPYKWGGFDSLQSFDAGLKAGKAAGD